MRAHTLLTASCACGRVGLELHGTPIGSVVCYCDDCQAGARQIEALPGAPKVQGLDGGTGYVVYRRDRVSRARGGDLLKPLKIRSASATNRMVASCCNSAMLLCFDDWKHWIDVYRERIGTHPPPASMRVCTRFAPRYVDIPADVPCYPGYPPRLLAKLMGARLAMLVGLSR